MLDSHPGPVDRENPGFNAALERAYAQAMTRARTASSFPHYVWALRELSAAMNDGHVGVDVGVAEGNAYTWRFQWAGVVTALRGDAHVVTASEETAVPVGAVLLGCDGTPAEALAEDRVGRFMGRWSLRSRRAANSGQLLLPADNPWLATLGSCTFDVAGK